jgi:NitT/TauT family transport system ATP-binding protein
LRPRFRTETSNFSAAKVYNTCSGDLVAIDRCSFDIGAEEIVSIVGPSAAETIMVDVRPAPLTAAVLLDGRPVRGPHPEIGMVFQTPTCSLWRNVDANIRLLRDHGNKAIELIDSF